MCSSDLAVMNHASFSAATRAAVTAQSSGKVWASLARYDDALVDALEGWESHTRDEYNVGRRRKGTEQSPEGEAVREKLKEGKWDKSKMVRSFARLEVVEEKEANRKEESQVRCCA